MAHRVLCADMASVYGWKVPGDFCRQYGGLFPLVGRLYYLFHRSLLACGNAERAKDGETVPLRYIDLRAIHRMWNNGNGINGKTLGVAMICPYVPLTWS